MIVCIFHILQQDQIVRLCAQFDIISVKTNCLALHLAALLLLQARVQP